MKEHEIIRLTSTSSTNDFMSELLLEGPLSEGCVVIADYQSAGKGLVENSWVSEEGKNLLFSLYSREINLSAGKQFYLSKAVALAIHDMLTASTGIKDVRIKWPNDILVKGKKISGSLIQCGLKNEQIQYGIMGIGLNVNQMRFGELHATSIGRETGRSWNVNDLMWKLISRMDDELEILRRNDFASIDERYHEQLFGLAKELTFSRNGESFKGVIKKVGEDGRLEVGLHNGSSQLYDIKEIVLDPTQQGDLPTY